MVQLAVQSDADIDVDALKTLDRWARICHHCLRYRRLRRIWSHLGNFLKEAKQQGRSIVDIPTSKANA